MTFSRHTPWGSFDACREVAERWPEKNKLDGLLPQTLTELCIGLCFERRPWRQEGYTPDGTRWVHTDLRG